MPLRAAIAQACALLEHRRASQSPGDTPVMSVGIDGGGGAGKSTLAHGIRAHLGDDRVAIVCADDFYLPLDDSPQQNSDPRQDYENYFDWRRLRAAALIALRAGLSARFQRHDWSTNKPAGWVDVPPRRIVVIEGVYSTRPELRDLLDLAIFVDTPREKRLARMLARGQNAQALHQWIDRWMAAEDWYMRHIAPQHSADLVVAGT